MQEAVAKGLQLASRVDFFEKQRQEYAERRRVLLGAFEKLGMKYTFPEGSYFVLLVR
jgi:kynurenine aminotransferase